MLPLPATVPPTVPAPTLPEASDGPSATPAPAVEAVDSIGDVISSVVENLADNGYQTGAALVVATIAVVAMLNVGVHRLVLIPVAVGAFWAGWLGWNTITGDSHALFPGDVEATKLWDVAFASDTGFLLVAGVACIAAVFLWRTGTSMLNRAVMVVGAMLGASFLYNLIEAFRSSRA